MVLSSIGKLHKLGHFVVVVQLIPGVMWADISCTTTKNEHNLCNFPLPGYYSRTRKSDQQLFYGSDSCAAHFHILPLRLPPRSLFNEVVARGLFCITVGQSVQCIRVVGWVEDSS